jgi:AcrR family transcriptional regulator
MAKRPSSFVESPWPPFETRRRARDEKREAVLRMAVRLFLEQGYYRATLDEVAERLNITKPALYNYFRSKDEILFECWTFGHDRLNEAFLGIDAGGGDGLEKLRKLIRAYIELMTTDFGAGLIRFDLRDLPEKNRETVRAARKKVDQTFRKYIAVGIEDGSIKPCDVKLSAFAVAGSLNWIAYWYQPGGAQSPQAIADEFALRLTEGLAAKPSRRKAPLAAGKTTASKTTIRPRAAK